MSAHQSIQPDDRSYIANAAAALGDRLARPTLMSARLDDIERALSRPLEPEARAALHREYNDLWEEWETS